MRRLKIELELRKAYAVSHSDFSNNRFYRGIPDAVVELHGLLVLNLSHYNLTGPIPSSFGMLILLQNNLVGPISHGKQFDTFDNDSYSGNLAWCGLPLSKKCGNDKGPKPPTPVFVEDEGSAMPFIWKLAMMGYGCGLVFGLSMGYIVFTTGRPWWFVRTIERDWQKNVTSGDRTEFEEDTHPTSIESGWKELGELISLQMLNFFHNNFAGPIPPSLGNMVALESLDLSSNKLGGRIPSQLTNLTFLAVLNLSENNLVGPIPHGNQFDTFDNDSYSGNLGLCGLPLSKQCDNRG
ncbi:serine/threonine-protein kinase BRI1-like 1 [Durio zibethinus]|uniref:Serine/threonine-protein kinase BRI1-like 1 n=1 Tax=Durio zibethinus TaxID=66656 RepID=A0A6P5WP32_DURZI|nr:serine/threonine-protein kinase BRI1-like 1 [Durio zibethinus]